MLHCTYYSSFPIVLVCIQWKKRSLNSVVLVLSAGIMDAVPSSLMCFFDVLDRCFFFLLLLFFCLFFSDSVVSLCACISVCGSLCVCVCVLCCVRRCIAPLFLRTFPLTRASWQWEQQMLTQAPALRSNIHCLASGLKISTWMPTLVHTVIIFFFLHDQNNTYTAD